MNSKTEDVAFPASMILLLGGIAVLAWQIYTYLRYNVWMPVSVLTLFEWMKIQWAFNPTDWKGIHTILDFLPLSAAMIASAWMVITSVN